jgi:hypothetical protein
MTNKVHEDRYPYKVLKEEEGKSMDSIERKRAIIQQMAVPWMHEKKHFNPSFFKDENGKIVKYESKDMKVWGVRLSTLMFLCLSYFIV